jgi:gluconolactonase
LDIIPFDEKIFSILDKNQDLQTIVSGFEFIEGPIWHHKDKHLTFSDIPASKMYRWSEKGGLQVLCDHANKPNGNIYADSQNKIITCEHATSSLVIRHKSGENRQVLASHYQGKELNSPNEVIVGKNGDVFFTDPYFGRNPSRVGVARERQLGFQGMYRWSILMEIFIVVRKVDCTSLTRTEGSWACCQCQSKPQILIGAVKICRAFI